MVRFPAFRFVFSVFCFPNFKFGLTSVLCPLKVEDGNGMDFPGWLNYLDSMKDFVLDRSVLTLGTFTEEPDDLSYWLAQPPATRLAGIEFLRRQFYNYGTARSELRRFFEIAEREPR